MKSAILTLAVGLNALLATGRLDAAEFKIELPPETQAFKPGPGSDLANGQCLICHSVEYVVTQPPFPRTFWTAEVKKMREKYGAPLPEEQTEAVADYLARNYSVGTNGSPAAQPAQVISAPPTSAMDGQGLATRYGCFGCHNVEAKLVGPPYQQVAQKYHEDPQAAAKITEQIYKGGSGKWGPVIMPPFPMITDAECKVLATWIVSRK